MKYPIIELLTNYSASLGNEILLMRKEILLNNGNLNEFKKRAIEIEKEVEKIERAIDYLKKL